ncbi:hypothetical protein D3C83_73070 [compost metagenome]
MLQPWATETRGACALRTFAGGHLFLQTAARADLIAAVRSALRAETRGSSAHDQVRSANRIA